jgi:two-component system, OmpR family, KDP operon response regulator KdpE
MILDLGLPDMDGFEVIREIRKRSTVPIIVLTVRDQQDDKILALDLGADDYLTKPFGIDELHARMKAILRRVTPTEDEPVFNDGKLKIDYSRRLVTIDEKEIDLSPTEYSILLFLAQNAGKVLTHRQIIQKIWNRELNEFEGHDHLLRVTICNLRSKLEPDPSKPSYIITEPAVGYRLKYHDKAV